MRTFVFDHTPVLLKRFDGLEKLLVPRDLMAP
jgi:hypothetical protein